MKFSLTRKDKTLLELVKN